LEELKYTPWAKGSFLMLKLVVLIVTIVIYMDVIQWIFKNGTTGNKKGRK
jgi:hypothetical protein